MASGIRIDRLANHPECLPILRAWFEREWPAHYGAGGLGDAEADLRAFANADTLPIGIIAFCEDELCGVAALKVNSIASRPNLTPWAGAGLVAEPYRRRGIGAKLLVAVEELAAALGFERVYCATGTSVTLLERNAWGFMERITHDGAEVAIYEKAL